MEAIKQAPNPLCKMGRDAIKLQAQDLLANIAHCDLNSSDRYINWRMSGREAPRDKEKNKEKNMESEA